MVNPTQSIFLSSLSGKNFWENLIDYAGIFPPSHLPLNEAINNYADYINGGDAWILGPFVFPAYNLNLLDNYMDLFSVERPLSISAVIRKSMDSAEMIKVLKEDLLSIQRFKNRYGETTIIDYVELPLPSLQLHKSDFDEIAKVIEKSNVSCYCEIPVGNSLNMNEVDTCIKLISKTNNLRAKLRTGSVKKELIPNSDVVSTFIFTCKKYQVPMKFTAGLHHPIRMYRDEVNTKMHGFINVFAAGLMAFHYDLSNDEIRDILSEEDHLNFSFKNNELKWNDLEISSSTIKTLRSKFLSSFGSCNFIGPVKEFIDLKIIEGGEINN